MPELIDVRSLLADDPSIDQWNALCEMIDSFSVEERNDIIIPYCRQHLEMTPGWTRQRRPAPDTWVKQYVESEEHVLPQLSLVSHIDLSHKREKKADILSFVTDISAFVLLRVLKLNGLELKDEDVYQLAQSSHFSQLKGLELSSNEITADGVKFLVESPHLGALQKLDLAHNPINDEGAAYLAGESQLTALRFLDLSGTQIEREGAGGKAIADSPYLRSTIKSGWRY
jgi:hypothetical protein